ncbi:MAG: class I SAM-dependent methyltransferase [Burkholderiales bacterium]
MHRITGAAPRRCAAWLAALPAALAVAAGTPADLSERRDNPPTVLRQGAELPAALVAPFVTTPMPVVDAMLALARVGPADFVVDLGSGDGRLVLAAVVKFGARGGFGVDIDATLVDYATRKAAEAGAADRVAFHVRDLFDTDVREATVITVYLLPIAMERLEAKLLRELAPGTRVVSHDYPFRGWTADRVVALDVPEKSDYTGRRSTSLYLYTVPARPAGGAR